MTIRTTFFVYPFRTETESIEFPPKVGFKKYIMIAVFEEKTFYRNVTNERIHYLDYIKRYMGTTRIIYYSSDKEEDKTTVRQPMLAPVDVRQEPPQINSFLSYMTREVVRVLSTYKDNQK